MVRTYTTDELIALMDKAPLPVQQAIESKETTKTLSALGTSLGLHIDQIGRMAELDTLMLLGLVSPQEFLQELMATGVSEDVGRKIASEINKNIFVPVQTKMRQGSATQAPSAQPMPQTQMQRPPMPQQPRPQMAQPRATPSPAFNLPGAPRFDRTLEDHEEPHINVAQPRPPVQQQAPQPQSVMPPPRPVMPASPAWQAPPQMQMPAPQPVPPPRPVMPAPPPAPAPSPVRTPPPPPSTPPADNVIIKEYGSDPYREPFQI